MRLRSGAARAAGCAVAVLAGVGAGPVAAATPAPPPDAAGMFAPFAFAGGPNAFRDGAGRPGPLAWSNRADYEIAATIEPATHVLRGIETITYTNNSPDPLDVLWVQLDQNIYRADARARFLSTRSGANATDGDVIERVAVLSGAEGRAAPFLVSDTRMQVRLATPVAAHGGRVRLVIAWHHTVPGIWGGRTAVTPTRNGDIFEMGQWYPRMAVYDDIRGWDTAPYLGQEFYLDYGDIDYRVTVPWNFIVAGSGALLNATEVLTATERARLAAASRSGRTVAIRTAAEVTDPVSRPVRRGTLTWHFRMANTRDVAFAASPAFVWDAARIDLPPVVPAPGAAPVQPLAMSVYPAEAAPGWSRSTEYVRHAITYFSSMWFPYPWPTAINLGGHGAGMEYPGMAFDDMADGGRSLFWITTHEIGHNWFPMIVGTNERRFAFMDEGFNTFIDVYASDHFNGGEYAPKRDPEYAPGGGNPADEIVSLLRDPEAPVLLEPSDLVTEAYRHPVTYFKSAYGLVLLRERILGPARFDPAFRRYIATWAYRHPTPDDFFRFMDSEAGEDLSWFWRGWYARNTVFDVAVTSARPIGQPPGSLEVTLENRGGLPLPFALAAHGADGTTTRVTVPAEAWMHGPVAHVVLPGAGKADRVTVDPDAVLPDADRAAGRLDLAPH